MSLETARAIADAVMMEGYALYPYRASAPKNRYRWTFGVLAPRAWSERGGCEAWWLEAQLLVAGKPERIAAQLRFFHIERRRIEDETGREVASLDDGVQLAVGWDEGIARTFDFDVADRAIPFACEPWRIADPHGRGRVVRERLEVSGRIEMRRERAGDLTRLTIRVENTTPWSDLGASRDSVLAASIASTHLLVSAPGGEILSAIDPPEGAPRVTNIRTYPALVGRDVAIAAPFILQDHPQIAPESAGDMCDATEIDELLMLRARTLTTAEKREARATDPRAGRIVDGAEQLSDDHLARMHGATRDVRDDGEMAAASPGFAVTTLDVGSKVVLRPPNRHTDAQDLLYVGRTATVAKVETDVDGTIFYAVTVDDDPLVEWYGRYRYYRRDEVEPR